MDFPEKQKSELKLPPELAQLREKILTGLKIAHEKLIADKIAKGETIIISRNGKVIEIPASEL
ncbi:MAG: histidine kinase [Bacteroidia bacterium]|nr:histidine kinase [Bacteroidia bacterium]